MIELENITKVYKMGKVEVYALQGVTLSIKPGEMVAIIGASGSGKSTLMNIIGCLDKPTLGTYLLEGSDVNRLNDNKLAEIILADEPSGNLDSVSTDQIISIFCNLNQEGITVVLVTHEMDIAEKTQRIIRLYDGKVISDERVAQTTPH